MKATINEITPCTNATCDFEQDINFLNTDWCGSHCKTRYVSVTVGVRTSCNQCRSFYTSVKDVFRGEAQARTIKLPEEDYNKIKHLQRNALQKDSPVATRQLGLALGLVIAQKDQKSQTSLYCILDHFMNQIVANAPYFGIPVKKTNPDEDPERPGPFATGWHELHHDASNFCKETGIADVSRQVSQFVGQHVEKVADSAYLGLYNVHKEVDVKLEALADACVNSPSSPKPRTTPTLLEVLEAELKANEAISEASSSTPAEVSVVEATLTPRLENLDGFDGNDGVAPIVGETCYQILLVLRTLSRFYEGPRHFGATTDEIEANIVPACRNRRLLFIALTQLVKDQLITYTHEFVEDGFCLGNIVESGRLRRITRFRLLPLHPVTPSEDTFDDDDSDDDDTPPPHGREGPESTLPENVSVSFPPPASSAAPPPPSAAPSGTNVGKYLFNKGVPVICAMPAPLILLLSKFTSGKPEGSKEVPGLLPDKWSKGNSRKARSRRAKRQRTAKDEKLPPELAEKTKSGRFIPIEDRRVNVTGVGPRKPAAIVRKFVTTYPLATLCSSLTEPLRHSKVKYPFDFSSKVAGPGLNSARAQVSVATQVLATPVPAASSASGSAPCLRPSIAGGFSALLSATLSGSSFCSGECPPRREQSKRVRIRNIVE